ncbi:hypothetical protein MMC10_011123 [Thelotrema lepadinum]|nr:hypothetical protein [Thelotrema lepadinum]
MVNRIIRDDPSKGDMHNRQALSPSLFSEALKDYDMWPIYLIGLTWSIPEIPSNSYITLIIESLGFDTFQTNLLTVPGYLLFIIQVPLWTWVSEKLNNRFAVVLVSQIWCLPILIALEVLPGGQAHTWARYALNIMLIYRTSDAPYYYTGNKVLIAIAVFNVSLILAAKAYYIWRNKVRERKWSGMNATEKEAYLDGFIGAGRGENGGEVALNGARGGNKRLDFRFVH